MSSQVIDRTDVAMMLLMISQMPIGLTPGFLSKELDDMPKMMTNRQGQQVLSRLSQQP